MLYKHPLPLGIFTNPTLKQNRRTEWALFSPEIYPSPGLMYFLMCRHTQERPDFFLGPFLIVLQRPVIYVYVFGDMEIRFPLTPK